MLSKKLKELEKDYPEHAYELHKAFMVVERRERTQAAMGEYIEQKIEQLGVTKTDFLKGRNYGSHRKAIMYWLKLNTDLPNVHIANALGLKTGESVSMACKYIYKHRDKAKLKDIVNEVKNELDKLKN